MFKFHTRLIVCRRLLGPVGVTLVLGLASIKMGTISQVTGVAKTEDVFVSPPSHHFALRFNTEKLSS